MSQLGAEQKKSEARVHELRGRAELAEQELKDRDAREMQAKGGQGDEQLQLKGQIAKQREQIILKSKAATAGYIYIQIYIYIYIIQFL